MQRRSRRRTSLHQGGEDRGDSLPDGGRWLSTACCPPAGTQAGVRLVFAGCPRLGAQAGGGLALCTGWFTVLGFVSCWANAADPSSAALIRPANSRTVSFVHSLGLSSGRIRW
jgi:hypothetical protein